MRRAGSEQRYGGDLLRTRCYSAVASLLSTGGVEEALNLLSLVNYALIVCLQIGFNRCQVKPQEAIIPHYSTKF
ncbi:hypothetical protein PC122_g25211 [Phytophthora cactorum]|nr:hypothetical protein PC122_g25211 [Phytophthora cactorum]